jgi:peptidyl-prolyl cis-trans isomerase SurA
MKRSLFIALLLTGILNTKAQTVFTYGTNQVSKQEFWRAFSKNNAGNNSEQAIREYLDLYIRFKLKVQAAKDAKLDTLPNINNDIAGFRAQIIDQYMRQQSYSKDLVTEAAERSATEIETAHIFIGYDKDSAAAKTQIEKAYKELQSGADFGKTAITYSTNNYVKARSGYIGYITVFSLPYELENIVYSLDAGTYSKPVAGSKGWHIFKVLGKRKSPGVMKAAQILFAIPQEATQEERAAIKSLADSVYRLLKNGQDFEKAALEYSNDRSTYTTGGQLPEFTFSKFDATFSKAAFDLKNDNDLSEPVLTSFGWHIIKRISLKPLNTDLQDANLIQEFTDKVNADARINLAALRMKEEMKKASGYKALPYNEKQLWALTDSMLKAKNYAAIFKANKQKPLFALKLQTVSVADWLQYAKSQRTAPSETGTVDYSLLMKQFTETTVEQYYKDRLETMNEDFRYQLKEFTEGSLLFEVMERNIWSKAPMDSTGLLNYYKQNKSRYKWQPSVAAVIFNCSDTSVANQALKLMKENPANWKQYMDNLNGQALADSGRFEYSQLPVKDPGLLKPGQYTSIETNLNDGSSSFCYILKIFPGDDQRSFEEAKGLVINDYQLLMEEKWINQLKKKYPVKVNEVVVKGLGK